MDELDFKTAGGEIYYLYITYKIEAHTCINVEK